MLHTNLNSFIENDFAGPRVFGTLLSLLFLYIFKTMSCLVTKTTDWSSTFRVIVCFLLTPLLSLWGLKRLFLTKLITSFSHYYSLSFNNFYPHFYSFPLSIVLTHILKSLSSHNFCQKHIKPKRNFHNLQHDPTSQNHQFFVHSQINWISVIKYRFSIYCSSLPSELFSLSLLYCYNFYHYYSSVHINIIQFNHIYH